MKYVGSCEDLAVTIFYKEQLQLQGSFTLDYDNDGKAWKYRQKCRYHEPNDIAEICDAIAGERCE